MGLFERRTGQKERNLTDAAWGQTVIMFIQPDVGRRMRKYNLEFLSILKFFTGFSFFVVGGNSMKEFTL